MSEEKETLPKHVREVGLFFTRNWSDLEKAAKAKGISVKTLRAFLVAGGFTANDVGRQAIATQLAIDPANFEKILQLLIEYGPQIAAMIEAMFANKPAPTA
jgi:hypothetical protein